MERIRVLKKRPRSKRGLIIVAASEVQVLPYIDPRFRQRGLAVARATWPGPVSWVFPANPGLPNWLYGEDRSIALRVSAHPLLQALCHLVGPLISTSANPSGYLPARDANRVRGYFANALDHIYPGRISGTAAPSRIYDVRDGSVLR